MKCLKLGGSEFDLMPGFEMPITFQIGNPTDLQLYCSRSTRFELPLTGRNIANLDYLHLPATSGDDFRGEIVATYEQDGVIQSGYAIIESVKEAIILTCYFGNYDFLEALSKKQLTELDLTYYEVAWTAANFMSQRTASIGCKWPLIDWFKEGENDFTYPDPWLLEFLLPAVFAQTILTQIIYEENIQIDGDFFHSDFFSNLLIPVVDRGNNGSEFMGNFLATNKTYPDQDPLDPPIPMEFDSNDLNISYKGTIIGYTCDIIAANAGGLYEFEFNITGVATNGGYDWEVIISVSSSDQSVSVTDSGTGANVNISISESKILSDVTEGDTISFAVNFFVDGPGTYSVLLTSIDIGVNVVPTSTIGIGFTFPLAINLPDISQSDFLKHIMQMMNLLCEKRGATVYFKSFDEILADCETDADDWSDKLLSDKPLSEFITDLAQNNHFKYTRADDLQVADIPDADIVIVNDSLPYEKDMVTLPYSDSETVIHWPDNIKMPRIPIIEADEWGGAIAPRVLINTKEASISSALTISDEIHADETLSTDLPTCHFYIDGQTNNLRWADLHAANYVNYTTALNKYRLVKVVVKLDLLDIYNLSMLKPKYFRQLNGHFLLMKINNWVVGKPCEIELINLR